MYRPYSAFQTATRLVFNLLRARHHLTYVKKGARSDEVPKALMRIRNYLSGVIFSASPNVATAILLQSSATNWLQINLQILEGHYEEVVAATKRDLGRLEAVDHQQAWEVAIKWFYKKYRPVLPDTINGAADDLEEVGWVINRFPKKQTPPLSALL